MASIGRVGTHLAALLLLAVAPASATVIVGGTITSDTVWTTAGGPYIVTSTVTVAGTDGADGVTSLTIEPGVQILFGSSTSLIIGGTVASQPGALFAAGTAAEPILFTSNQVSKTSGFWNGVRFQNFSRDAVFDGSGGYTSGSILQNATVEYGGATLGGIDVINAAPYIADSVVRANGRAGIFGSGASGLRIDRTTIESNGSVSAVAGLFLSNTSDLALRGVTVTSNTGDGIQVSGSGQNVVLSADPSDPTEIVSNSLFAVRNLMDFGGSTDPLGIGNIDARNVLWGTMNPDSIALNIFDHTDNPSRGLVVFQITAVPEPSAFLLFGAGIIAIIRSRRGRTPAHLRDGLKMVRH